jgi:hypothetical protein
VLRTVPGLFRDDDRRDPTTQNPVSWFWPRRVQATSDAQTLASAFPNVFEPDAANEEPWIDVAASVLGHRDPVIGHTALFGSEQPGIVPMPISTGPSIAVSNGQVTSIALARTEPGIDGLRRTPGFGSLGELLAVGRRPATAAPNRASMDWLARDGRTIGSAFIEDSNRVTSGQPTDELFDLLTNPGNAATVEAVLDQRSLATLDGALMGDLALQLQPGSGMLGLTLPATPTDAVPDDYAEQLAQINMLLNSASTSSDYFAAWFLVHGYEDDDVENLGDTDPLVPSFRARYLLILDRSNVVRQGDRPRVLAFVQLPLDATEASSGLQ